MGKFFHDLFSSFRSEYDVLLEQYFPVPLLVGVQIILLLLAAVIIISIFLESHGYKFSPPKKSKKEISKYE